MHSIPPTRPLWAHNGPDCGTHAPRGDRVAAQEPPLAEFADEVAPVIGVIAVAGPPVIFVMGPWLLMALMLSGPFALLVAVFLVAVALFAVIALTLAILAAPYLLVRYALERRARRALSPEPVPPLVSIGSRQVAA